MKDFKTFQEFYDIGIALMDNMKLSGNSLISIFHPIKDTVDGKEQSMMIQDKFEVTSNEVDSRYKPLFENLVSNLFIMSRSGRAPVTGLMDDMYDKNGMLNKDILFSVLKYYDEFPQYDAARQRCLYEAAIDHFESDESYRSAEASFLKAGTHAKWKNMLEDVVVIKCDDKNIEMKTGYMSMSLPRDRERELDISDFSALYAHTEYLIRVEDNAGGVNFNSDNRLRECDIKISSDAPLRENISFSGKFEQCCFNRVSAVSSGCYNCAIDMGEGRDFDANCAKVLELGESPAFNAVSCIIINSKDTDYSVSEVKEKLQKTFGLEEDDFLDLAEKRFRQKGFDFGCSLESDTDRDDFNF